MTPFPRRSTHVIEVERLVALGATVAWEEDFPAGWPYRNLVLRDPEENEFCLGDEPAH